MGDVQVDATAFFDRLSTLYNAWKADKRSGSGGNELFGGADTIVVLTGKAPEETQYVKNNAVHVSRVPGTTSCWRRKLGAIGERLG
jgi:hypothetical protein